MPFDVPCVLIVDDSNVGEALRELAMVGLDRVAQTAPVSVIEAWKKAGGALEAIEQIDATALAKRIAAGDVRIIDVRGAAEWRDGHIAGVPNIPLGTLPARMGEIANGKPVVLQCQGGGRSSIAASILAARGATVINLDGGFDAWTDAGLPVEQ